jgi:hypothetical protein
VEGEKLVLKPLDLWDRVWKCCRGSAEEAERELDRDEKEYWRKREAASVFHDYLCCFYLFP